MVWEPILDEHTHRQTYTHRQTEFHNGRYDKLLYTSNNTGRYPALIINCNYISRFIDNVAYLIPGGPIGTRAHIPGKIIFLKSILEIFHESLY